MMANLGSDHGCALADPAQGLAQVARAAHKGDAEVVLVDVVVVVGRREDLALVDVVDVDRLEYLGLHKVTNAHLGHDRDRHRLHDLLDHRRVAHARHAAVPPDVRRHSAYDKELEKCSHT
jgi:hypothetical protein